MPIRLYTFHLSHRNCNQSINRYLQWCRRRGCRGWKRIPKSFDLLKIPKNLGKICENFGKIPENPNKIPENLGKIPENLGKNGAQHCLTSKNGAQGLQKNKWRPFVWRSHHKNGQKSCTTTFWASLGKFGQKSFAHPIICLLLHMWLLEVVLQKLPFHCTLPRLD